MNFGFSSNFFILILHLLIRSRNLRNLFLCQKASGSVSLFTKILQIFKEPHFPQKWALFVIANRKCQDYHTSYIATRPCSSGIFFQPIFFIDVFAMYYAFDLQPNLCASVWSTVYVPFYYSIDPAFVQRRY